MTKKISKLITYLSILEETLKVEKNSQYVSVDIELPEDLVIHEIWDKAPNAEFSEREFHTVEVPIKDIDSRIKIARDHLRYRKKRSNGQKYGE